jgi:hypothetical protein
MVLSTRIAGFIVEGHAGLGVMEAIKETLSLAA